MVTELVRWSASNWGNVLKLVTLFITAIGFFVSIKVDIAVLKSQAASLELSSGEVNNKVDRLYDYFFSNRLNVSER